MKRTLLIASLSLAAAGSAFAQSSVTVWGRLNVSAEDYKELGGVKDRRLENNASRLGFRGVEDLGGGLKAGFALEHGFDPTTGQAASRFWGRGSEVYLSSNSVGTIRLGNFTSEAYYATADYVSLHNHDTGNSADRLYAYLPNDTNKVAYRTPEFGGLTAEVAVSEGQPNAGFETEKGYDVAVNYNLGALAAGLGYQKLGASRQFAIRGLYTLGAFTFGGYYQNDDNGFGSVGFDSGKRNTFRLSGMYAMGANEFHLNYGWADDYDNIAESGARQWTVAYGYNLSKRTRVYAFYTKLDQDDANFYGPFKSSLALGVRHNF